MPTRKSRQQRDRSFGGIKSALTKITKEGKVHGSINDQTGGDASTPILLSEFDARQLRQVLGDFATGVTVLASENEDGRLAITANAFTSVSLEPPLVLVSIDNRSRMLARLADQPAFSVNILGGEQEHIARCYGSSKNKPDDGHWTKLKDLPVVAGAVAHLGCKAIARHEHGDHHVVIAQVDWLSRRADCTALTFHRGQFGLIS
jgi:flavin reductase (DIM6/NTAB) family NADH-FMN oxidoreductase RutF